MRADPWTRVDGGPELPQVGGAFGRALVARAESSFPVTSGSTHASSTNKAAAAQHFTEDQKQAVGSAQDYLETQSFSRSGLIGQLDSKDGSGFAKKDAVFAVNHIKVNWNKEAVKSAKEYLSTEHFSRSGLIGQLDSKDGSGFTKAQATQAANQVGL
jgi:Host cell surface-exposed lipoprotein